MSKASLFKDERATLERIEKFISKHHFTDCNLRGRLYGQSLPLENITHVDFGQHRVTFEKARTALEKGENVSEGFVFGPTWSTHWFRLSVRLPESWLDKSTCLRWNSGCEAMVWSEQGQPLQGLSSNFDRTDFHLRDLTKTHFVLYIECAANEMFGAGNDGMISPPNPDCKFTLSQAQITIFRSEVYQLLMDFDVLYGFAKHLPKNSNRRFQALYTANAMINVCDTTDSDSMQRARNIATDFLSKKNGQSQFEIFAVGNCHIDTAWLWPYDETRRKCARSWSTTLRLMENYPKLTFAISQAQQISWLRDDYPGLYSQIQTRVKEGRFIPVGGAWVEMDGNLPSGESFVRQMLYGQHEFMNSFGRYCTEFWLPDTFGYSAQIPQIIKLAGMDRFLTQKISWNFINKFPHHTFFWEGIDGTKVLTHFPGGDSYVMEISVEDCLKTVENFKDKGRSNRSMMLYGFGDGGGGPSSDMCERLQRLEDVDGSPKVREATPGQFFEQVENSDVNNLCTWSGELFLELHNATYTTQAETKHMNRLCEFVLRDSELIASMAWLISDGKYCRTFEEEWKKVLLNQFHDVLPGTSISDVYFDAKNLYKEVYWSCMNAPNTVKSGIESKTENEDEFMLNSLPWERGVIIDGHYHLLPSMSLLPKSLTSASITDQAKVCQFGDQGFVMENSHLRAELDQFGRITSITMRSLNSKEQTLFDAVSSESAANEFMLYDDVPLYWDAWDTMDYHLETGKVIKTLSSPCRMGINGPLVAEVHCSMKISDKSSIEQIIRLTAGKPYLEFETAVNWHENHKFLKVNFPLNVKSQNATYEIQFGHLQRPTHRNTSWDAAKYEVCGHKWACLSETNFGVALLNDSKYGYSCHKNTLTLSLLRAPKAPDDQADMGNHNFTYAIMPFMGTFQKPTNCDKNVIQAAYELNCPVKKVDVWPLNHVTNFCSVDNSAIIIETVKIAENKSGLIIRLYESFGGKASIELKFAQNLPKVKAAFVCDILERKIRDLEVNASINGVCLCFKPFEIVSVLVMF